MNYPLLRAFTLFEKTGHMRDYIRVRKKKGKFTWGSSKKLQLLFEESEKLFLQS